MAVILSDEEQTTRLPSVYVSEQQIAEDADAAVRGLIAFNAEDLAEALGLSSYLRRHKEESNGRA